MAHYIFRLKKKNIEIELSSTDAGFIARQMQSWQDVLAPGLAITRHPKSSSVPAEAELDIETKNIDTISPTGIQPEYADVVDTISPTGFQPEYTEVAETVIQTKIQAEETEEVDAINPDELLINDSIATIEPEESTLSVSETLRAHDIVEEETETIEAPDDIEEELLISQTDLSIEEALSVAKETVDLGDNEFEEDETNALLDDLQKASEAEVDIIPSLDETGVEQPEEEIDSMVSDYEDLLDTMSSEEIAEEPEVRVTEGSVEAESDVMSDEMEDISSLLADFDDQGESVEESTEEGFDFTSAFAEEESVEEPSTEAQTVDTEDEFDFTSVFADEEEAPTPTSEKEEVEEDLSSLLEEAEKEVPAAAEIPEEDDFDAVISAMAAEVEEEPEPEIIEEPKPIPKPVAKPKMEPVSGIPSIDLKNYLNSINIKTPVDLLLATARYMEEQENYSKFTTKDISGRTLKAIAKQISPAIFLAAVNKGYIEVVPDFTGTAESNEYALTDAGRDYLSKQLS
jgi:hypothetical protein